MAQWRLRLKHHNCNTLRGNRGVGLLVLVMVMGLCSLFAIGATVAEAEFSLTRLKLSRTKKNDMLALKYELNFVLGSRDGCIENLKTFALNPSSIGSEAVPISTIEFGDTSGKGIQPLLCLTSAEHSFYGRVPVKRMSLSAHPTKFGSAGAGTHLAVLEVEMGKIGNLVELDNKNLPFNRIIEIPLYVTTDASGTIQSCHSTQYAGKNASGDDQTIEEKLCNDTTVGKTANWPEDCLSCLNSKVAYHLCIQCKALGKEYDPATKKCA